MIVGSTHLSTNHNSPGNHIEVWVLLDSVVQGDDVESVEHLSLVLVDALHLAVKHGVHVDLEAASLLQILCKPHLVILFKVGGGGGECVSLHIY